MIRNPSPPSPEDLLEPTSLVERTLRAEELARQSTDRLAGICKAQQEIAAAAPDEQTIWNLVADRARVLTGADGAHIEMAEADELVCCATSGPVTLPLGNRCTMGGSFSGICVRREEVLYCRDSHIDEQVNKADWAGIGARSILCVPLPHQFYSIGVLSIVSRSVNAFGQPDIEALQMLAYSMAGAINQAVVHGAKEALLAEHTRTIVALRESEQRFRNAFDCAPIGMALVGIDGSWIKVNLTLCDIVGRAEHEFRSLTFHGLTHPEDTLNHREQVRKLLAGEISTCQAEMRWSHKSGSVVWILLSASLLRDGQGHPLYLIAQILDITERKRSEAQIRNSLREKEVLLKEVHHRVKNNLQVISSLLNLQSGYTTDRKTTELFGESQNRVRSMALIHEKLYQSEDLGRINLEEYVVSLVSMLFRFYGTDPSKVKLQISIDRVTLNLDTAIPVGLLVHELVSNSLKYAFPDGRPGTISINFRGTDESRYVLRFNDDGVGLPTHFDIDKAPSLGLRLVKILTNQLGGELLFDRSAGTEFAIAFSIKKATKPFYGQSTDPGS
jgi:PAS domain S-box-containing protein